MPHDQSEIRYARKTTSAGNAPTYMLLWLDQSQRPHETGQRITPRVSDTITKVETWLDESSDSEDDDDESTLKIDIKVPAIMGPSTSTYPRDIGWHLPTEKPETEGRNTRHKRMSDVTIKTITKHFTSYVIGEAKPNCITNWPRFIPFTRHTPFDKVFASFGTPISDATEERHWRKLVQRATFVRNRDPKATDHRCRLCNQHEEQIHRLFQCSGTAPLWRECINFTMNVLKAPRPQNAR